VAPERCAVFQGGQFSDTAKAIYIDLFTGDIEYKGLQSLLFFFLLDLTVSEYCPN